MQSQSQSHVRVKLDSFSTKSDGSVVAVVAVSPIPDGGRIRWAAAAPAERNSSESGSCLPFANAAMAFEGSRASRGDASTASVAGGGGGVAFEIRLRAVPNSFYTDLGSRLVPPSLYVSFEHEGRTMQGSATLVGGVPFRSLTYPAIRKHASASLYDVPPRAARSQAEILFASAYPRVHSAAAPETPDAFWGGKPPV